MWHHCRYDWQKTCWIIRILGRMLRFISSVFTFWAQILRRVTFLFRLLWKNNVPPINKSPSINLRHHAYNRYYFNKRDYLKNCYDSMVNWLYSPCQSNRVKLYPANAIQFKPVISIQTTQIQPLTLTMYCHSKADMVVR